MYKVDTEYIQRLGKEMFVIKERKSNFLGIKRWNTMVRESYGIKAAAPILFECMDSANKFIETELTPHESITSI